MKHVHDSSMKHTQDNHLKHISYSIDENIQKLSDKNLLTQTDLLACEHRKNSVLLLRHLREIEVRRLFVDLGFSSMHKYCLQQLKFSEGETQRRLTSARLLAELPEIENKIEAGQVNVTNLSKIQSFLRAEKAASHAFTKSQKLELIDNLQNKSTREVERELISLSHQPALLAEKFQGAKASALLSNASVLLNNASSLLSEEFLKFETYLSKEHQELLTEFKNLYAHELIDSGNGFILMFLLEKAVQHKKKKLGLVPEAKSTNKKEFSKTGTVSRVRAENASANKIKNDTTNAPAASASKVKLPTANNAAPLPSAPKVKKTPYRSYIRVHIVKHIWQRARACCEHVDPQSGKRCDSKFALELDHIQPLALGGTEEVQNLRLLCRAHNSRRAIKTFG